LGTAASILNQIIEFLEAHDQVARNNIHSAYYKRKFELPYERLKERGYDMRKWNEFTSSNKKKRS
jgi:hypothetical protein